MMVSKSSVRIPSRSCSFEEASTLRVVDEDGTLAGRASAGALAPKPRRRRRPPCRLPPGREQIASVDDLELGEVNNSVAAGMTAPEVCARTSLPPRALRLHQ